MAEESIGTARIDVKVNTGTMEAGIEAAKRRVAGLGNEAETQFNKANASTKRYADSLLRQADMLGKSRAEQIAYNAQMRIGGELGEQIAKKALAQQAATATGMAATGKSAKELQFAMRGLPAQITDIGVSLASGQRPMMVLLQQGGQLKDMFGGIVPAAKALGGSLLALINPYTLAAAGAAALVAAWSSAEKDASAFNNALISTGNYADRTATQMEAMVGAISGISDVSEGSAREALQKVAETGRFTGEQFDLVAVAAARMQDAAGQSIDDTVKKFEDLAKSPVDALLKLNETEHFLTEAQLERVRALVAEGKEQDAAAEAARIYAGRLDDVATAAEAARPHLSRMWKEAKDGASAAWEETKKFADFLAAAAEKAKDVPWYQRLGPIGGLRASISGMYGAEPASPARVSRVAGAVDSGAARANIKLEEDAAKFRDRYLTREEEKKRAIAELDKYRAQYSAQEYENLKKQINLQYADKGSSGPRAKAAKSAPDFMAKDQAQIKAEIEAEGKLMDQRLRSEAATKAYAASLRDMLDTRQQSIDLQVASIGMGQREVDQQQALISIDQDYNRKKADLQKRQQDTSSALEKAGYQQQLDDLAKYHAARVQMEIEGWKAQQEAQADGLNGVKAALADFMADQQNNAAQMYDLTRNFLGGFSDAFASFASGAESAKDAFGGLIDDMYKQALKFLANKAMQQLLGALGGTQPGSTSGNGSGGWAGVAASAAGMFSGASGRANGGPVSAGSLYRVNERGPELLEVGGKNYLMMGKQSGNVDPSPGTRSTGNVSVNQTIVVQGTINRRTSEQIAQDSARRQRIATTRNA